MDEALGTQGQHGRVCTGHGALAWQVVVVEVGGG